MSGPSAYCNVEDLPGEPSEHQLALGKLHTQHTITPFEDVTLFGNTAMLTIDGELAGSVDLESLMLFGAQA